MRTACIPTSADGWKAFSEDEQHLSMHGLLHLLSRLLHALLVMVSMSQTDLEVSLHVLILSGVMAAFQAQEKWTAYCE